MYFYTVTHHQAQKFCNRVRTRKTIWLSILFHNSCPLLVCSPSCLLICNIPCLFSTRYCVYMGLHVYTYYWLGSAHDGDICFEIVWLWLILYILSPPIFLKIFWVDLVFQFFFQDRVVQAVLEFTLVQAGLNLPSSAAQVFGLKVCATTPSSIF